jgi:FixJ family two-component response regulator
MDCYRMNIHVVGDDESWADVLKILFESAGWRAQAFSGGGTFLRALQHGVPDCAIVELNMRGMNGVELQEALTTQNRTVPLIMMTCDTKGHLATRALAAGAHSVLGKFLSHESLMVAVLDATTTRI